MALQDLSSIGNLNERDNTVVARRLAGQTVPEIAVALGCSVDTVYRSLRRPAVRVALAMARSEEIRPLLNQAVAAVRPSVQTLEAIRDDEANSAAVRAGAAKALLDWFRVAFELAEVQPQIEELRAAVETNGTRDASESDAPALAPRD